MEVTPRTEAGRRLLEYLQRSIVTSDERRAQYDADIARIELEAARLALEGVAERVRGRVGDLMAAAMLQEGDHADGMCAAFDLVFDQLDAVLAPFSATPAKEDGS